MANLTPQQLATLRQMAQQGGQSEYYDPAAGRAFMPNNGSGWTPGGGGGYTGEGSYQASAPTEYRGYDWAPGLYSDNFELNGTQYDRIDPNTGEATGRGTWEGLRRNSAMDTLAPFAMAALPFALSMSPSLGAAASFGTNPVTGAAGGGMSGAGLGGSGAFVGEAPWTATGGGPLQFGSSGGGGGLLDSIGNGLRSIGNSISDGVSSLFSPGTGSVANPGGSELFLGEGMASGVPGWDAAATKAGLSLVAPAAAGNKALGLLSTVAGAAMGAQGKKEQVTESARMDPRLDPYIFGAPGQTGLLQHTQSMLDKQMSPGALAGYDDMRRIGQGLLGGPVAGNGFTKFFPGR